MPLIKKCDLNEYSCRAGRARLHPFKPASQPDATGFSGPERGAIRANQSGFAKDSLGEHPSPHKSIEPSADEGRGALLSLEA